MRNAGLLPPRRIVVSIFAFVQLAVAFGVIPSIAFSMLASGVQALRAKLPKAIPKSLLHRLRYTRWALYFLACLALSRLLASDVFDECRGCFASASLWAAHS